MSKISVIRRVAAATALSAALLSGLGSGAAAAAPRRAPALPYVPGVVVVGYDSSPAPAGHRAPARDMASAAGVRASATSTTDEQLVALPPGQSVMAAAARLRGRPGVAYAVPDYIAHAAGGWFPNDRGRGPATGDWRLLQWNFLAATGVDAPDAWLNLFRDAAPGGRGVTVAILDTGVAFRAWRDPRTHRSFRRSPDFAGTKFVSPCDLLRDKHAGSRRHGRIDRACSDPDPLDRNGHGTLVAGIVGEGTNNRIGVTGLAYGATLMPLRVLDAEGNGDSLTIARGIRYAVLHGAQVINLSLEFTPNGPDAVRAQDIPEVISAIQFAHRHGAVVVAAAGNDSLADQIAYPAADQPDVISVGATTRDGCLATYSNAGPGLDVVAPGGGDDAASTGVAGCRPGADLSDADIFQMTFADPVRPNQFSLPSGWYGTSMAAPHVSATAALVIASGVLGPHPSPQQVLERLEQTARALGPTRPNADYGYGLIDAGAATAGHSQTAAAHRRAAARARRRRHKKP